MSEQPEQVQGPERGQEKTRAKSKKKRKAKRRGHGEGTIGQRPDGRWMGQVTIGRDPTGKQIRKTVYGSSQKEVQDKLFELRKELLCGVLPESEQTLGAAVDAWLAGQKAAVAP